MTVQPGARPRQPGLPGLVLVETRRVIGGRGFKILLLLSLLPLLLAVPLRSGLGEALHRLPGGAASRLWLAYLGSSQALSLLSPSPAPSAGLTVSLTLSLNSFSWLVAAVVAAALVAGDLASGRLPLLAARPLPRTRLLLAKLLAATAALYTLFLAVDAVLYAAATIIAGRQAMPWLVPVHPLATALALTPITLLAFILGLRIQGSWVILAVALVYMAAGTVNAAPIIAALASHGDIAAATATATLLEALNPVTGCQRLPGLMVDALLNPNAPATPPTAVPAMLAAEYPTYLQLLAAAAASTAAGAALLWLLAARLFKGHTL